MLNDARLSSLVSLRSLMQIESDSRAAINIKIAPRVICTPRRIKFTRRHFFGASARFSPHYSVAAEGEPARSFRHYIHGRSLCASIGRIIPLYEREAIRGNEEVPGARAIHVEDALLATYVCSIKYRYITRLYKYARVRAWIIRETRPIIHTSVEAALSRARTARR